MYAVTGPLTGPLTGSLTGSLSARSRPGIGGVDGGAAVSVVIQ